MRRLRARCADRFSLTESGRIQLEGCGRIQPVFPAVQIKLSRHRSKVSRSRRQAACCKSVNGGLQKVCGRAQPDCPTLAHARAGPWAALILLRVNAEKRKDLCRQGSCRRVSTRSSRGSVCGAGSTVICPVATNSESGASPARSSSAACIAAVVLQDGPSTASRYHRHRHRHRHRRSPTQERRLSMRRRIRRLPARRTSSLSTEAPRASGRHAIGG